MIKISIKTLTVSCCLLTFAMTEGKSSSQGMASSDDACFQNCQRSVTNCYNACIAHYPGDYTDCDNFTNDLSAACRGECSNPPVFIKHECSFCVPYKSRIWCPKSDTQKMRKE